MHRRTVLATLGTLTALGVAGCTDTGGTGTSTDETATATGTASQTDTRTTRGTPIEDGTPTTTGAVGNPDSRFASEPCPSLGGNPDGRNCWHTSGDSPDLYIEPSTELFEPSPGDDSVETMAFVLHNESGGGVGFNPYDWTVYRRTDGDWERVAPDAYPEPWEQLEAGGTHTWQFAIEEQPAGGDSDQYPVADLDDGIYAFEVTVAAEDGPRSGESVRCIALFEVQRV